MATPMGRLATRLRSPLKSLMTKSASATGSAVAIEIASPLRSDEAVESGYPVESAFGVEATSADEKFSAQHPSPAAEALGDTVHWHALVERVQKGDDSGMADLYRLFAKGIRFYLCRQLGAQEIDDKIHDTFLIVVKAIQRGDLREPERLMGFVRTVVRRQVAAHIDHLVHRRRDHSNLDVGARVADDRRNPEQNAALRQKIALMTEVLRQMSDRDREVLTRFYLQEQSQEQICDEMTLTETQFRLLKSRAKARFGELGQKKLKRRPIGELLVRKSRVMANSGC
jgi:RNA polymerase sigma-70 factor, ECF subfamily